MAARGTEWDGLGDEERFALCVRESAPDTFAYVALLAGRDRREAESVVRDLYDTLAVEARSGAVRSVTPSRLRAAARRLWLGRRRRALADSWPSADQRPVTTLAELSDLERTVVVLRGINRMSTESVADALGLSADWVGDVERRAIRRLGGDVSGGLTPWFGEELRVRPGFVDELLAGPVDTDRDTDPDTDPDDTVLVDTVLVDTVPVAVDDTVDAAPVDVAPVDVAPVDAAPVDAAPVDVAPVDVAEGAEPEPGVTEPVPVVEPTDHTAAVPVIDAPGAPAEPGLSGPPGSDDDTRTPRRRRLVFIAVAVLIALVAAAAVRFATRGDDEVAGETTTPPVTEPIPTEPAVDRFDPVCTERAPDPAAPAAVPVAADAFAPLGAQPALTVELPVWRSATGDQPVDAGAVAVPGGVIVTVRSPADAAVARSLVARVGLDGTVGWIRCFDEAIDVRADGPDAVGISGAGAWLALDPVTGLVGDRVAEPALPAAAFTPPGAWPDESFAPIEWDGFRAGTSGDIVLALGCTAPDPAADRGCGASALRGYAASGVAPTTVAATPATTAPPVATVPPITVPAGAAVPLLLWQLDGVSDVLAVRDGFALVRYSADGGSGGWYLVQVDTGVAVDGQVWGPDRFPPSCCEADASAQLVGGTLIVRDGAAISVWLPAAVAVEPATVAVP